jgi:hypothetical protein
MHLQMKVDESTHHSFHPDANYIKYRRYLVDWMCEVGEELRLHHSTIHVAVKYLDRILPVVKVERHQLQLVALSCIMVASKFEEAEDFVPSVSELNEYTKLDYTPEMIQQMEVEVLNRLDWRLTAITPLHFLGYYLGKGCLFCSDMRQGRPLIDKLPKYMKKYVDFFANLCLQEYSFEFYNQSELAGAILMASRRALQITPQWRPELTQLTGYSQESITKCFQHVWGYYEEQFPTEVVQQDSATSPTGVNGV